MPNVTISISDDDLALLDKLAAREGRPRSNMVSYMARHWDDRVSPQAGGTLAPRRAKAEKEPLLGADGVLKPMLLRDERTLQIGARFILKNDFALPPLEGMDWAMRPPVTITRVKPYKIKGRDTVYTIKSSEGVAPRQPKWLVIPDDVEDHASTFRVWRVTGVATGGPGIPRNNVLTRHHWTEAMGWVPDPEHVQALIDGVERELDEGKIWSSQHAYGAGDDAQLKELLTTLEPLYNLTDDAKAFIDA